MVNGKSGNMIFDAINGNGLSFTSFCQTCIVFACFMLLMKNHPEFAGVYQMLNSQFGTFVLCLVGFWIAPLKDFGYIIDRVGAIRANIRFMAPYGVDLLPTLPEMLPFTQKIIDNIEVVGPFIPKCMQKGVKEHMLPLMPEMMPDLEIFLGEMDTIAPLLPKMAPHMKEIMPYSKQLIPHVKQLACIMEVDGWWKVNPYMPVIVPHIAKIAPHSQVMAKHMNEMLPYMDIMAKHIDNLIEDIDETVAVMDKLVPLLPLLPAADQAGLLSQKMAFKMLPTVVGLVPLSNETTGRGAVAAAHIHGKVVQQAGKLQNAVMRRIGTSTTLAIEDAKK